MSTHYILVDVSFPLFYVGHDVYRASKKTSLFTYIYCVVYYNNRDLIKLDNNDSQDRFRPLNQSILNPSYIPSPLPPRGT